MRQAFQIDSEGFAIMESSIVVSDEIKKETVDGVEYWVIDVDGLFRPRLVDGHWEEGATEEEIAALTQVDANSDGHFSADEVLEAMKKLAQKQAEALKDDEALEVAAIFDAWKPDEPYIIGDKVNYRGKLWKVLQSHTSQGDWTPDTAVSLFMEIAPPGNIPDWKQPTGSHDAYKKGDKVKFDRKIYESLVDGNTWSPSTYPQGWKVV